MNPTLNQNKNNKQILLSPLSRPGPPEREREEGARETDRQTERQTDRQIDKDRDRGTDTERVTPLCEKTLNKMEKQKGGKIAIIEY